MKAERAYPRFTITAKGTRWVEGGHPWIYAQEIISANLPGISKWLADLLGLVQSYSVTGLPYND